mgnify:CR=1 FL=1
MKLIIQIPCYNEEESLPVSLGELPREVEGFDQVEWLIIDDGSRDRTVEVARSHGVDHVVSLPSNQGLAKAFMAGIEASLAAGADVIVNTDADNQYDASGIPELTGPVLSGEADIVVGARPIQDTQHFSVLKKLLQRLGSWVVRKASGSSVVDAPSGFRSFSRKAALGLNVFSSYTYTLETIIQAGQKNLSIVSVPVSTNPDLRESRLLKSMSSYVWRSMTTIVRMFVVYKPFPFFLGAGLILFVIGFLIGFRFLLFWWSGAGDGHIQSLILAAVLLGIGFQTMLVAFIADLLAVNRRLLEEIQQRLRRTELEQHTRTESS